MHYVAYTDGACKGNPGPGGWGYLILLNDDFHRELYRQCGGNLDVTNNQMEIQALTEALRYILSLPLASHDRITIFTDSQYVKKGITEWLHGWVQRGWITAQNKPVKNAHHWQSYIQLKEQIDQFNLMLDIIWEKDHAGNLGNEFADNLANEGVLKAKLGLNRSSKSDTSLPFVLPNQTNQVDLKRMIEDLSYLANGCISIEALSDRLQMKPEALLRFYQRIKEVVEQESSTLKF